MSHVRIGPLVRATTATEATIWLELSQPCIVQLQVTPYNASNSEVVTIDAPTITIGGHYYAAPQMTHLQPATWYNYRLSVAGQELDNSLLQCFRTLTPSTAREAPLRLLYGSCRKLSRPQEDTLAAFGRWLQEHAEERETLWPHLLLFIGDQIYADQPAHGLVAAAPQVRRGATSFEDFTHFYRHAWTNNEGTRQALAAIPIYMTPDDHELTNSWNTWPTWYAELVQKGKEQIIIDGLVAYWVYQGWGNLSALERQRHPLAQMMHGAAQSGQDIIEELRAYVRTTIEEQTEQRWHYQISTTPPIFVINARADRTEILADNQQEQFKPLHIMGEQQMADLRCWLAERQEQPAIIVSSVPVILPPVIGLAEYLTGVRLWSKSIAPLRWIGERLARLQLYLARRLKFDHWPIYSASWKDLIQAVRTHPGTALLLSGDVHFSYTAEGRVLFSRSRQTRLYQLVSTPIENSLSYGDMRLIKGQSLIPRMIYGGLDTRLLPLEITASDVHSLRHLLFENTLAFITLQSDASGHYTIQQEYYGLVDGRLNVIARITLS